MDLNSDFSQRVLIHSDQLDWQESPMPGVDRRMLDRIGGEVARATTIVRYAPGSQFSAHTHTGGEEFIVLDGVFQDEHGDFPAGTYVRNPPTSAHTPGSDEGCVIFVKLWQFEMTDRTQFHVDMEATALDGKAILHQDAQEIVRFQKLAAGDVFAEHWPGGGEILILAGDLTENGDPMGKGSWLRSPQDSSVQATAGPDGATIWIKTGHLPFAKAPPFNGKTQTDLFWHNALL